MKEFINTNKSVVFLFKNDLKKENQNKLFKHINHRHFSFEVLPVILSHDIVIFTDGYNIKLIKKRFPLSNESYVLDNNQYINIILIFSSFLKLLKNKWYLFFIRKKITIFLNNISNKYKLNL